MSYNLLEEKWIPVLWKDGKTNRVGIIEALTQAGRIRQVAASNPMDRVAVLRFLLALLYWCQGSPTDKAPDGSFPRDWFKKLYDNDNKDCFNLFGKKPFYQDREADGKAVAVTYLLHDLPSGTNIAHFRHVRDFHEGLCLACCAMGLLRWSCFATAGTAGPGQSMTASVNGNTPSYSIKTGASLFDSLLLNWPGSEPVNNDVPSWKGACERTPLGFLKGMTWQSRRVLLLLPESQINRDHPRGRCCYCGAPTDRLVKEILFRPGWQRSSKEPWADDPQLLRVNIKDSKGREKSIVPSWPAPNDPLEDHAGVWHSILKGLLQRSARQTGPTKFHTILVGASQQLYKHVEAYVVTMPILNNSIQKGLIDELEWLRQLTRKTTFAGTMNWNRRPKYHAVIEALSSKAAKGHAIRAGLCAVSFLVEERLEKAFRILIQELRCADQSDTDTQMKAMKKWREEVCRILCGNVEQVVDLTTTGSALRRRQEIRRATEAVLKARQQVDRAAGEPVRKKGAER